LSGTVKRIARMTACGILGALLAAISVFVVVLERRPDLEVWHTARLDAEFTTDSGVVSFQEYLELEDRLFAQLDELVYARVSTEDPRAINRYQRGSIADPARWSTNWNRSFELIASNPRIGVLMLHGLSDSPYSMRSLARSLHEHGAEVVVLRLPGHGTAPSGLVRVDWQDMAAAVTLAIRHLRNRIGDRPIYIVGYSNGAALAVHYALSTLDDDTLPAVRGLVLLSPEIGVTELAALAAWQERLGHLLGLEKLAWNTLSLEYDPFKYNSFALNAGKLSHELTSEILSTVAARSEAGNLDRFPSVLAFQSVVDATVVASVLVEGLLARLPAGNHELVLFDVNRMARIEHLLKKDPRRAIDELFADATFTFAISLVTNQTVESRDVVVRRKQAGERSITVTDLGLAWPENLYSLSHIALPFPPDDPLYGGPDAGPGPGIQIGNLVARGERGVLQLSASDMLRIHWNPFHAYMERRMLQFMGLSGATEPAITPAVP
jgi:alpha-beta hydrolase superfamily lysophospholipase